MADAGTPDDDADADDEGPSSGFLLVAQILMWTVISLGVIGVMVVVLITPH